MANAGAQRITRVGGEPRWDIEIKASRPWWRMDLGQLWHYKDLLLLLVKKDITAQYAQTILGPLWLVLQPMLTTLTYMIMFGLIARSAPAGVPPMLFYLSGIVPWTYFANVVNRTSRSLIGNSSVLTKVYFPRLVMPISSAVSSLVTFLIQMVLVLLIIAVYVLFFGLHIPLTWHMLIFPVLVLLMSVLGLGAGIIVSAMTTKYKDLGFMVAFGVQLLMFMSPVIFPLSLVGQKAPRLIPLLKLNPMTPVIESMRSILFGGGLDMASLLQSALFATVLFLIGLIMFQRIERSFADTV